MSYDAFLAAKQPAVPSVGFTPAPFTAPLFLFQQDIVRLACVRGRFCIWADCGMGKTAMQLEWAAQVCAQTGGRVLILAPLAVSQQTAREAEKFGIGGAQVVKTPEDIADDTRIVITNYQRLHRFDTSAFVGVVLDESSILKAYDGKTRGAILEACARTPYRLACSATPAPNDYMELGNHAEFVGVMTREEMLAMFFTHDGGDTSQWRLKGHAAPRFWEWVCTWAATIRKPSDLGYPDGDFRLPPLTIVDHVLDTVHTPTTDDTGQAALFATEASSLTEQRQVQRASLEARVARACALANGTTEQVLVWCHLNDESTALAVGIDGAVEVTGSDSDEWKERVALWFSGQRECVCQTPSLTTTGSDGTRQIQSSELRNLRSGVVRQKRTRPICASTTSAISTCGISERRNSGTDTTRAIERSTRQTRNAERKQNGQQLDGARPTQPTGSLSDSGSTGCPQLSTSDSWPRREDSAPSAGVPPASMLIHGQVSRDGYTSITATRPVPSEGCSVRAATLVSGNSATTPSDLSERRCICGRIAGRKVLISKPSLFGLGLNFQTCAQVIFVGLSHSYEAFYQAIRRCWRFGQTREVQAHVIYDWAEGAVVDNLRRKELEADAMAAAMVDVMRATTMQDVQQTTRATAAYTPTVTRGTAWTAYLGDCVEVVGHLPEASVHYSIFSPPFASLYTYSNSDRDMGNCRDADTFMQHFRFLIRELQRVLVPGRLVSFHCMNLPTSKQRDGVIGITDFRGDLIRAFEAEDFIFHSEVCIWKDPVTAMQRTKAIGLLHKQLVKDSALSRQGIPDYLVTMRKRGDNPAPVAGKLETFVGSHAPLPSGDATRDSINIWQRYASPVWMDINPSDTLQFRAAREDQDERHICPLQLDVIRRGVQLWSNPGDVVLSPFMGIGSEGYVAVEMGRQFIGAELKESYWRVACDHLAHAESRIGGGLFADVEEVSA